MTPRRIRDQKTYVRFVAYLRETGLDRELKEICLRHRVTLRELYLDVRGPTVYAARIEVWWYLTSKYHKSSFEIARPFDRDASSITYALTKLKEMAAELGHDLEKQGAYDTAKEMSKRLVESYTKGRRT